MPYRVAVVLQETTDTPGRWRTTDTRLVSLPTTSRSDAMLHRLVAVVSAQHAVATLEDAGQVTARLDR